MVRGVVIFRLPITYCKILVYLLKKLPSGDHSGWNIPAWAPPLRRICGEFQVNQEAKYPYAYTLTHKQRKSCWFAHSEEHPWLLLWETDSSSYEKSQWSVAALLFLDPYENLTKFVQVSNSWYLQLAPAKRSLAKDLPQAYQSTCLHWAGCWSARLTEIFPCSCKSPVL